MKVSILTPIFGVEKYIKRCATSLFEQTYENIEYIFVNDCTRDDSVNILKSILENYPNRKPFTKIIEHEQNMGLGVARNTAINAATGDFVMHVDSDDYIDSCCIEKCVRKQMETNADIVSFNAVCEHTHFQEQLKIAHNFSKEETIVKMINCTIAHVIWGRLIRKSLYTNNNIQVEECCGMGEDTQVVPRLFYCSNNVANLDENLYFYNCTNNNSYTYSFSTAKSRQALFAIDVLRDFFKDKGKQYTNAIDIRETRVLAEHLVKSVKKSPIDRNYYSQLQNRIKRCPKQHFNQLSLPYRIALSIKNYYLFVVYVRFSSFIKDCKKKIQKKYIS